MRVFTNYILGNFNVWTYFFLSIVYCLSEFYFMGIRNPYDTSYSKEYVMLDNSYYGIGSSFFRLVDYLCVAVQAYRVIHYGIFFCGNAL